MDSQPTLSYLQPEDAKVTVPSDRTVTVRKGRARTLDLWTLTTTVSTRWGPSSRKTDAEQAGDVREGLLSALRAGSLSHRHVELRLTEHQDETNSGRTALPASKEDPQGGGHARTQKRLLRRAQQRHARGNATSKRKGSWASQTLRNSSSTSLVSLRGGRVVIT